MDNIPVNIRRNYKLLWIRDALIAVSTAFSAVSILQAFFLKNGLSNEQIAIQSSFGQLIFLLGSVGLTGLVHRSGNILRSYSVSLLLYGFSVVLYIPFCLKNSISPFAFLIAVMGITLLINVWNAVRLIYDYQIPCMVMDVRDYSFFTSVNGIICGVVGFIPGLILTVLYSSFSYNVITMASFALSAVLTVPAAIISRRLKPLSGDTALRSNSIKERNSFFSDFGNLFGDRDFRALIIPNFVRGLGTGLFTILPSLAITAGVLDAENASLITSANCAATFASCSFYAFCGRRKVSVSLLCILGSVLLFAVVPALSFSKTIFLILYFVAYSGYNIVCYAVPDIVYRTVRQEIMSAFHTWRMAITTLGTIISTMLIGRISEIKTIPGVVYLLGSALCMLYCGIAYALYFRKSTSNI